jgi:hypothetical protein
MKRDRKNDGALLPIGRLAPDQGGLNVERARGKIGVRAHFPEKSGSEQIIGFVQQRDFQAI